MLRDAGVRSILLEEIGEADRVVLLGDVVELREQPVGALARPPPAPSSRSSARRSPTAR